MAFVDEARVFVRGGRGGDGSASLHSEPFKPRGGPDGGNGGPGGSVVFRVSRQAHDLSWLADHPHQRAADGKPGRSSKRGGATGADLVIDVPDGTRVTAADGLIADLVGEGSAATVARGGRGGRGNAALAGSRDKVPKTAERGEEGEDLKLFVELRTVADVGLVGLPNAGKSTLLAAMTRARPKVADYPFTTLTPNLGVSEGESRFVVADIPGLVEGASSGRGLGHRFLRHIMRCPALVMVVDLSSDDPSGDLSVLREELAAFDPSLAERPSLIVGTKADLVTDASQRARTVDPNAFCVSAVTGEGLPTLEPALVALIERGRAAAPEPEAVVVLRPGRPRFTVERKDGRFVVVGRQVERWVADTDLDDERAVAELQKRLVKEGVEKRLAAAGARRGDEVQIAGRVFEYIPEDGA